MFGQLLKLAFGASAVNDSLKEHQERFQRESTETLTSLIDDVREQRKDLSSIEKTALRIVAKERGINASLS